MGNKKTGSEIEKEGKISVIIPLYGSFDTKRTEMSIDSLKRQRGVDLEIIVAEQSNAPKLSKIEGIKHVRVPKQNNELIPGKIRNQAIRESSGEFIYNNDGDIIFPNYNFLLDSIKIMEEKGYDALYRPPMRRLPLECFHEFKKYWKKEGLENSLKKLDTSERHIAKTPECEVGMKVFEKYESGREKRFLFTTEDHKKYLAESKKEGKEPKYSSLDVHGGGIIMKKKHFYLAGGYCERYMAWGCHDADLQWKISNIAKMEQFPGYERYEVLHLDHKRDHFDEKQWKINREIQKERKKKGVLSSIKEDKK